VRRVGHRTAELLRPSDGIRLVYRALSLRGLAAIKHLLQPEDELTSAANLLNQTCTGAGTKRIIGKNKLPVAAQTSESNRIGYACDSATSLSISKAWLGCGDTPGWVERMMMRSA
jgi:hypothetical protein